MSLAGWVLLGLLGILVIVLAIPVELRLRIERTATTRAWLVLGLFAGRLDRRIELGPGTGTDEAPTETPSDPTPQAAPADPPEPTTPEPDEPEATGPSGLDRARQGLAVVRSEGFLRHTGRWLKRLVTSFSIERLSLWFTFGTGDPADTGVLFGRFQAAMPIAHASRRLDVDLTPDFDRTVFEGGGELTMRVTPLRLLWVSLVYLFSPTTLRAAHAFWRARPDA